MLKVFVLVLLFIVIRRHNRCLKGCYVMEKKTIQKTRFKLKKSDLNQINVIFSFLFKKKKKKNQKKKNRQPCDRPVIFCIT